MFQIEPEINTVLFNKCVKVIKQREHLVLSILKRCHLSFFEDYSNDNHEITIETLRVAGDC